MYRSASGGGALATERQRKYDVLVIGAGVIGLSTAYHIKKKNPQLSVLVMDRSATTGQGDTAKSMAALRDTFTSEVNRLLAGSTIDFYRHVQSDLKFNLNLDLVGYLWLMTGGEFQAYEGFAPQMLSQGVQLKEIERDELSAMIPDLVLSPASDQSKLMGLESVHKAVLGINCGIVAPELIVKYYENELRGLGVEFQFGTDVKSLRLAAKNSLGVPGEPFTWQEKTFKDVETNRGTYSAETIVLATGIRTPMLLDPLGIDCLIKPRKNNVFQLRGERTERLLRTKGFNEHGTIPFTILPKGGVYFRPVPGERSFWTTAATGFGQPLRFEEEPIVDASYYTYNVYPILSEYFPCFADLRPVNSWSGFYDVNSVDSTPIVARISNCIIVAGMSGSGIMKADAVGRMAAAILEGREKAELFGDRTISTSILGLSNRMLPKEKFVL